MEAIVKRKDWIDVLRAWAMIFVVFGHAMGGWTEFFVYTSPIKMPMFFAISGYLFNIRNGKQSAFFKNIFLRLIVPWILLSTLPLLLYIPLTGVSSFFKEFLLHLSGEKGWFIPCFIIAQIIFFYTIKVTRNLGQLLFACLIYTSLGLYASSHHLMRFMCIDVAFTVQFFFLIGHLIRKKEKIWEKTSPKKTLLGPIAYILLCTISLWAFPGKTLDVHMGRYFNYAFCAIIIIIGCVSLFVNFSKLKKHPKILIFIGKSTLVIYLWNMYFIGIIRKLFTHFGLPTDNNLLYGIVGTTFACLMCTICSLFLERYFPWIIGIRNKK